MADWLKPRQRDWLKVYAETGGDSILATRTVYKNSSDTAMYKNNNYIRKKLAGHISQIDACIKATFLDKARNVLPEIADMYIKVFKDETRKMSDRMKAGEKLVEWSGVIETNKNINVTHTVYSEWKKVTDACGWVEKKERLLDKATDIAVPVEIRQEEIASAAEAGFPVLVMEEEKREIKAVQS